MRSWSIRAQLLSLTLAVALPLAGLLAWNLHARYAAEKREAEEQVLQLARLGAAGAGRLIGQARRVLQGLAQRPAVRALDPARCDPLIQELLTLAPRTLNVLTARLDGSLVCSALVPASGHGAVVPRELYLDRLRESGDFTVGAPARGFATGRWVLTLAHPVRDAAGRIAGAVGVTYDLLQFPLLPDVAPAPGEAMFVIFDARGTVIARSAEAPKFVGSDLSALPAVAELLARRQGVSEGAGADGVTRVFAYTPVPDSDWIAAAGVPAAVVREGVESAARQSAQLFAALLLAVLYAALRIGRGIARPIRDIAATARAVADGRREARAAEPAGAELAVVARELNRMLDARVRAEEALRASEQRFRLASSTGEIWDWNIATGEIALQPEFWARLGYERVDAHDQTALFASVLHPDDVERWRRALKDHLAQRAPYDLEFRARTKSGEYRWFHTRGQAVRDPNGDATYMAGTTFEITGRKRAEDALRAAAERFQKLFLGAPGAMSISELESGRFLEVNEAFCAMFGWPRREAIGRTSRELELWTDTRGRDEMVARLRAGERVTGFEGSARKRSGALFDVLFAADRIDFGGTPALLLMFTDVSARKQAEEALRQAHDELRQLIDNLFLFVGLLTPEGVLIGANRTALEAAGLRDEDVHGLPVEDTYWIAYDEASRARMRESVRRAAAGEPVRDEIAIRVADGRMLTIDFALMPVRGEDGRVTRLVSSGMDITERKRAEEALRAANRRLHVLSARLLDAQEAERAAIARELHDEIGQALTALKLSAQMLARTVAGPTAAKLDEFAAIADRTLAQARSLTRDLRPPELEQLGLAASLREHLNRVAAAAGFVPAFASDDEYRALDARLATAVFRIGQEALTNAARHAGASAVAVGLRRDGTALVLEVSDDGRGFESDMARERAIRGASMGILGMEERAALAGATLRIDSRPGGGTRVEARFPLPSQA